MKSSIIILLLVLIPLVVMSRAFEFNNANLNKIQPNTKFADRTWRMNQVVQESNDSNQWFQSHKYQLVYNSQYPTVLDTMKYIGWETDINEWVLYATFAYTYDSNHEYVTHIDVNSQHGGVWQPMMRSNFTYDNQHRLTFSITESYNYDTTTWGTYNWTKITYSSNTNFSVCIYNAATGQDPQNWKMMNFTWDSHGRIATETDTVSPDSVNWINYEWASTSYHPNDTTTGDIFVSNVAHMMPMQNMLQLYPGNVTSGMVSEELWKQWDGNAWVNANFNTYTYNTSNLITQYLDQEWYSNTWNNNQQMTYTYDTNNNLYQVVQAHNNAGQWVQDNRYTCSWGQATANDDNTTPAFNGLNLSVSPNPFTSEAAIRTESKTTQPVKYNIYNTKGQLIRTIDAYSNAKAEWDGKGFNNQDVSNGIYFIKADIIGKSNTIKILKLK